MKYTLYFTDTALRHLVLWRRSGQTKTIKKLFNLIGELETHPETGTGHPERLCGDRSGQWSRTIDKKNRLVYSIDDTRIVVDVLSAMGHYDDR